MASTASGVSGCPVDHGRDDRKSGRIVDAALNPRRGSRMIDTFAGVREVLRSPKAWQGTLLADDADFGKPDELSVIMLHGDPHRRRRLAIASLFTPKAVSTRYREIMEATMDAIVAGFQRKGSMPLDELSWQMAVDVIADIVGLTDSDSKENLAARIKRVLDTGMLHRPGWIGTMLFKARMAVRTAKFFKHDMVPAIAARRIAPRDDLISIMLRENYSKRSMIMECITYGGAGMLTTREFIVMAAWHLFDDSGLRDRFLASDEGGQFAILDEIIRLEPVGSLLHRRAAEDEKGKVGAMKQGELLCVSLRGANFDEAVVGERPYALDPDRAARMKVPGSAMSFGDGPHRCPGAQLAMHETRLFLDRLFRVPGLRMVSPPEVSWNDVLFSYELRGCVVACDVDG